MLLNSPLALPVDHSGILSSFLFVFSQCFPYCMFWACSISLYTYMAVSTSVQCLHVLLVHPDLFVPTYVGGSVFVVLVQNCCQHTTDTI